MRPEAELSYQVDRHDAVLVLLMFGRLTITDGPAARAAILRSWGESPRALVLDLAGLAVADDAALLVLQAALRETRVWPPVPVLLVTPDRDLATRLPELPRWFADREQALAAATVIGGSTERVAVMVAATPQAPAQARAVLGRTCRAWQLADDVLSAGEVVVSELCANVVVHAGTEMEVVIRRTPVALHIVVRDGDASPPVPRPVPADGLPADSGNGLQLVTAFASSWGTMPAPDGKAVWASFRIDKDPDE